MLREYYVSDNFFFFNSYLRNLLFDASTGQDFYSLFTNVDNLKICTIYDSGDNIVKRIF